MFTTKHNVMVMYSVRVTASKYNVTLLNRTGNCRIEKIDGFAYQELSQLYKRLSYCRGTAQCCKSVEVWSIASQLYEKLHLTGLVIGQ